MKIGKIINLCVIFSTSVTEQEPGCGIYKKNGSLTPLSILLIAVFFFGSVFP